MWITPRCGDETSWDFFVPNKVGPRHVIHKYNDVLKKLNGEGQVSDHYGIYGRGESRQTIADLALTEPVEDMLGK